MDQIAPLFHRLPAKLQKRFIANAVDTTVRLLFPDKYFGLCYLYAILGANVSSVLLDRSYVPVAGIALINAGNGNFIELLDNDGFFRDRGGAFHCWIESTDRDVVELVDFTFRHNKSYAESHGLKWKEKYISYLWGKKDELLLPAADRFDLPPSFPSGKSWYQASDEGTEFLRQHMAQHVAAHARLTEFCFNVLLLELQSHFKNREKKKQPPKKEPSIA